jgi:hypothetical protein
MPHRAVVVLTAKSFETLLREGGTSSWRLDRNNARQCEYVVCTRNANAEWVEGPEAHHSAFLVAKIRDVVSAPDYQGRFLIQFGSYARIDIPSAWKGDRNPVRYMALEDLGVDPASLKWELMHGTAESSSFSAAAGRARPASPASLTIMEAKRALAHAFGVREEAVEITIRA